MAATIVVALCYAIGPIIIDRKLKDVPAIGVITGSLILATANLRPFAPFLWPDTVSLAPALRRWSGLGVLCTAVAFIVFFALIAEVGPARATVITYVNPGRGHRAGRARAGGAADALAWRSAFRW